MSKKKAVTHADLSPSRPRTALGSKTGLFLMVLTLLCGLFCFILCLIAEATRSRVLYCFEISIVLPFTEQFIYEVQLQLQILIFFLVDDFV